MFDTIMVLLKELEDGKPHLPPTLLFNEGWLLRLILHWFSQNNISDHPLSFSLGAVWFSEGLLSSQFLPVHRGDELAESYTHADGVIGNIEAGGRGKTDIQLVKPYEQFVVLEAKLFSKLSAGIARVPGYNQAARNIACMVSVAAESKSSIDKFKTLGFYVIAPETQIKKEASFEKYMQKESVHQKVRQRVETYKGRPDYDEKKKWFGEHFEPLLSKINVSLVSWEIIIGSIKKHDNEAGERLARFYDLCLEFNSPKS